MRDMDHHTPTRPAGRRLLGTALTVLALAALTACSGGGSGSASSGGSGGSSGSGGSTVAASGSAQKGPFQPGGTASIVQLAADGSTTGQAVQGDIGTDGAYSLGEIAWSGPSLLTLSGSYFDETSGQFSADSRELQAVVSLGESDAQANVNLYTHFAAARIRHLMGQGSAYANARSQTLSELQTLLGVEAAPEELDLLEAADSVETDSANLLLFSAALLAAGQGQAEIDAIAADFADNGLVDGSASAGAGSTALSAVQQAAQNDPDLLSDAQDALQSQYGKNPPQGSSQNVGWIPGACESTRLDVSNRPVICTGDDSLGPIGRQSIPSRSRGAAAFVVEEPGIYALTLSVPQDDAYNNGNTWELRRYGDADNREGCEYGTAYAEGAGDRHIEGLTDRSGWDERYCLEYYVAPSLSNGGASELTVGLEKISEGGQSAEDAVELTIGETHAGVVGNLSNGADDMPAYSYYVFRVTQAGDYRITADSYSNGGAGSLRIALFADDDDDGNIRFYNDIDRVDFIGGAGTNATSTVMDKTLASGLYAIRIWNGTDWRTGFESNYRALTGIDFNLLVEKQ